MTGNDDLFQLIKSMSKSEKRYFKLDAKKSKGNDAKNKYVQLFDAINSMDEYDETILKNKAFVKHLSVEKGELYRKILRSMRSFRSDKSAYAQIKEMILDAGYLSELGLLGQSEKLLKKAKNLAYQVHHHLAILEINREERYIARLIRGKTKEEEMKLLIEENDKVLHFFNEEMSVLKTYDSIFALVQKKYKLKDEASRIALNQNLSQAQFNEDNFNSVHARQRLYRSKAFYYGLLSDYKEASRYQLKVLEWWNNFPKIKSEETIRYLRDINNLINSYFNEDQYDGIEDLLDQLRNSPTKNLHEQSTVFYFITLNELTYYMNTGNFEKASQMIPEIEKGIKSFNLDQASKVILLGNVAILSFIREDYKESIIWLEKILRNRRTSGRQDIQQSIRILKIVSLLELGEIDLLENEFRATSRYFQVHTSLEKENYETIAFFYLKKIYMADNKERKQFLQELDQSLQKLSEDPKEKRSVGFDELRLWVQSRLQKQSIIQYMKLKGFFKVKS